MLGDGVEVMMVEALVPDLALLAHQDMALAPTGRPAQALVQAPQGSLSLLVVTLKRLNAL